MLRLFYLRASARFGWTRSVLLNQIKAAAFERSLKEGKSHSFQLTLPEHLAERSNSRTA
jgi:predicted nuclease of restriction endonuclease-like (RecB) superfamily